MTEMAKVSRISRLSTEGGMCVMFISHTARRLMTAVRRQRVCSILSVEAAQRARREEEDTLASPTHQQARSPSTASSPP